MRELANRIGERARSAMAAMRKAEECGDEFGAQIYRGELDSLRRIARNHGLTLPDLAGPEPPAPGSPAASCAG